MRAVAVVTSPAPSCCTGEARSFGSSLDEWPSGACVSACGKYRYTLWRRTVIDQPTAAFILKNPSTADHAANDASTHNCRKAAAGLGLGAELVNLYPWRGDVASLLAAGDARYGDRELNAEHIRAAIRRAQIVVLGFGDFEGDLRVLREDIHWLRELIEEERRADYVREIHALRVTVSGAPWHPARLSRPPTPIPYSSWPQWLSCWSRSRTSQRSAKTIEDLEMPRHPTCENVPD